MSDKKKEDKKTSINIRYVFNYCNDIDKIRHFYSKLIGMKEIVYVNDNEAGYVVYQTEGFQFMWFKAEKPLNVCSQWANQPGYSGGVIEMSSFAIDVPEENYDIIIKRLKKSGVKFFNTEPEWRQNSYWGVTVMDPMGNTVEIYTESSKESK